MRTDLQSMGCGNCGCFEFHIYTIGVSWRVAVECVKCGSVTVLRPEAALRFDWGDDHGMKAEGVLAPMEKKG